MEYYPAIKRNETGAFTVMWMNLESVIQSEASQKGKNKCNILTYIWIYMESRIMVQMNLSAGQE